MTSTGAVDDASVDAGAGVVPTARHSSTRPAWLVAGLGALVFVLLAGLIRSWDASNEQRLLNEETEQAGALLQVSINQFLDPLTAISNAVEYSNGDVALFERLSRDLIASSDPPVYARIALVDAVNDELATAVGGELTFVDAAGGDVATLVAAVGIDGVHVFDLLAFDRTLGLAVPEPSGRFVVYAERELRPDPNARGRGDGPFGNVDYAIYLGDSPIEDRLLGASTDSLPLSGSTASTTMPYGDTTLLLSTSPIGRLGNGLLGHLWWIVLAVGSAVTALTALLVRNVLRGREQALELAEREARHHEQQRDIAETFQLELLPQRLRPPPGCRLATRYWVADTASLIGGDFYDVFPIDADRWGILIGDVCGKGTPAAALTGLIRHTVRTASRFIDSPAEVLRAVHDAMAEHTPPTYCTAVFMIYRADVGEAAGGEVVVSVGGHPRPLLRRSNGCTVEIGESGTLLGLIEPELHDQRMRLADGDLLLTYTDGLTDAPQGALEVADLHEVLRSTDEIEGIAAELRRRRGLRPGSLTDDTAVLLLQVGADAEADQMSRPDRHAAPAM